MGGRAPVGRLRRPRRPRPLAAGGGALRFRTAHCVAYAGTELCPSPRGQMPRPPHSPGARSLPAQPRPPARASLQPGLGLRSPSAPRGGGAFPCPSSWGAGKTPPCRCPVPCSQPPCSPPMGCPDDRAADRRGCWGVPTPRPGPPGQGPRRTPPPPQLPAACSRRPSWPSGRSCPNEDVYSFNHQIKCLTPPGPSPAGGAAGSFSRPVAREKKERKNSLIFINRESHLFPGTIFDLSK